MTTLITAAKETIFEVVVEFFEVVVDGCFADTPTLNPNLSDSLTLPNRYFAEAYRWVPL